MMSHLILLLIIVAIYDVKVKIELRACSTLIESISGVEQALRLCFGGNFAGVLAHLFASVALRESGNGWAGLARGRPTPGGDYICA